MFDAVKGNDSIAALQARRFGSTAARHPAHHRRRRQGHSIHQRAGKRDRKSRQYVHHWPGQSHQKPLPARPQIKSLLTRNVSGAIAFDRRIGFIATEFDVTAERNRRNAIIRLSPFPAKESRAKTD